MPALIPNPFEPLTDQQGKPTRVWWRFWRRLNEGIGNDTQNDGGVLGELASLEDRLSALELQSPSTSLEDRLRALEQQAPVPADQAVPADIVSPVSIADLVARIEALEVQPRVPTDTYVVTQSNALISALTVSSNDGLLFTNQTSDVGAGAGTLTNAPTAGDPAYWLRVKVNGTNYAIPLWTA